MEEDAQTEAKTVRERPKGRPRKDSISPDAAKAKPFPAPPRATEKGGVVTPERFWAYRKSLPREFDERLTFYVNREWPKLDFYQHLTKDELEEIRQKKRAKPVKYAGQYADIDPDNWRNELLRYHGSGDYKIYLNDTGVRGNPALKSVNVCRTFVSLRDDEFPPDIKDLSVLDLSDPINNSFIQKLRLDGTVIPGDAPRNEDNDDMAANIALETMANALVESTKTKQTQAPVDNTATALVSDMLKSTQERHLKEMELSEERHRREIDALTKRLEQQEKVSQERGRDPLETTRAVVEMAKAVTQSATPPPAPPPPDNKMIDLLMQMVKSGDERRIEEAKIAESRHAREMEAVNKRLELQEQREITARQQQQTPVAGGASSAVKDVLSVIDAVGKLKSGVDGLGSGSDGPQGPWWLEPATEIGTKLIDGAQSMMHNWAVAKAGQGTPLPPPTVNGDGTPTAEIQQSEEDQNVMMMKQYAKQIKDPLCQALRSNMSGSRFAGDFLVRAGEMPYQFLVGQGEAGLFAILQSDSGTWGEIIKFGAPRVQQFITEFLDTQAAVNEAAMIRAGNQTRPTVQQPPPAGRPANAKPPSTITVDATPVAESQVVNGQAPAGRKVLGKDGQPLQTAPPTP